MRQMYYLCTDMKRGYVRDRWGDVGSRQDRPHVVMFFSKVQPDFKILSLCKWDVRMLSSNKQELDRYDGATQEKEVRNDEDYEITHQVESESESELESELELKWSESEDEHEMLM